MKIIASSIRIQEGLETFLHAGYLSAAAPTTLPPPSPEALAAVRNPSLGEIADTFTTGDLKLVAIGVGALVVLVLVAWLWAWRANRLLQTDVETQGL
jgi:hypothetical protein